jgi:hypothetical protein
VEKLLGTSGLWLLLVMYGLVCVAVTWRYREGGTGRVGCLVLTHNQEHQIEGAVRALTAWLERAEAEHCRLVLADLASTDQTPLILERMAAEHGARVLRLPPSAEITLQELLASLPADGPSLLIDLRGQADHARLLQRLPRKW